MVVSDEFSFTSDKEARMRMTQFIREKFSGLLGPKIRLLDQPNGLDLLSSEVHSRLVAAGIRSEEPLSRAA